MSLQPMEIFPTHIFHADWEGDTEAILQHTKDLFEIDRGDNVDQTDPDLYTNPNFKDLFDFLDGCLQEIHEGFRFKCDGFKITTAWANKYAPFTANQFHRHPMSAWSGVFFLTDGAPFAMRDPIVYRSHPSTMPLSEVDQPYYTLPPVPGRVVIFPHWLEHGAINDIDQERYSIAFNSMPYGKVNFNDSRNLSSAILSVSDYE